MSWHKSRNNLLILVFFLLLILLGIRLFWLTGVEGESWAKQANTNMERTIRTSAFRGEIYDRNGVLLAGNHSIYAVDFSRNGMTSEQTNATILLLINILERHGEKLNDDFPIKVSAKGNYYYTFDREIKKWLKANDMPADYTADQAFAELRLRNNISDGLNAFEAQKKLQEDGIYPPISVKTMSYSAEVSKRSFLDRYKIDDTPGAEAAFRKMVSFCGIDKQYPDMDAAQYRNILIIRNALYAQGFMKWLPVTVADAISEAAVIELDERSSDLPGVEVVTESVRYYPEKESAAHIIGYMGKISDSSSDKYVNELGYNPTDIIGLYGIEKSQEEILHGIDGMKRILVDADGNVIRTVGSETSSKKGSDIALTIDIRLQKIAEDALKEALEGIRVKGRFKSEFGNYKFTEASPNARVGAAVAIDIKSGEPLAIASEPGFDPNLFAEGISTEDWNALQGDNPRDPLAPRPLYNVAARTAVQPGSTFKPMIGMVAQQMGLSAYTQLYDIHAVKIGDREFTCLGHHGNVNLFSALQASCNVYFYDAATGRNWARRNGDGPGADLGYANKINPDVITKYAKQFGLGIKTGAEIDETIVAPPTAEKKMNSTRAILKQKLLGQAEYLFSSDVLNDYEKLDKNIDEIVSWIKENPSLYEIQKRMKDLGVKSDVVFDIASEVKYTYFNFAEWTTGDEFNIAIGQGENAYTPLQMARYLSTIGSGGKLRSMSLIKAVEGTGEVKRPKAKKAKIESQYITNVIEGMRRVVTGGTLNSGMAGLGMPVAGKTGTAQRAGYINPPDEVVYVKEHLSGINPQLSWKKVEKEMNRLMREYPRIYTNSNTAVRKAVQNLSGRGFNSERIDAYKQKYADFSWVMAMAPADDPQIAVVCLIVQGGPSVNASPVVREIIGQYFKLKAQDEEDSPAVDFSTFFTEDRLSRLSDNENKDGEQSGEQSSSDSADEGGDDGGEEEKTVE